jgi:HCOMODA/2-hydroxy-3-carboxy-muconic semialdehyde decarboxylase
VDDDVPAHLRQAAHAVARAGLSDAFGHLSVRTAARSALVTPPLPLGELTDRDALLELDLDADELPAAAPREAWLHLAVLRARPQMGAICRAQPPAVAAWAALQRPLPVLNGHAALLGDVATRPDSRLVRDLESAQSAAAELGDGAALILRGNGALTAGVDLASAVAAMWLLERTADLALRALAAGAVHELPPDEQEWWRGRSAELLPRIYRYLVHERQPQRRDPR